MLFVQWKTPDDGQTQCPKHVEFYSENKFEKLVNLVGFIIKLFLNSLNVNCAKTFFWTPTALPQNRMTGDLERTGKETVLAFLRYYPEGLRRYKRGNLPNISHVLLDLSHVAQQVHK